MIKQIVFKEKSKALFKHKSQVFFKENSKALFKENSKALFKKNSKAFFVLWRGAHDDWTIVCSWHFEFLNESFRKTRQSSAQNVQHLIE
jgi:hypothetical protein